MTRPPKYAFHLTSDGVVRVVRTDGVPITQDEVDWLRSEVSARLRAKALEATFVRVKSAELETSPVPDTGVTRGGVRFDLDPAVAELDKIRIRQGLSRNAVTNVIKAVTGNRGSSSMVTDWALGKSRPFPENLRAWAAVLNRALILVPAPLLAEVRKMISEWEALNEPTPAQQESEAA